jgi:hypothetical protein
MASGPAWGKRNGPSPKQPFYFLFIQKFQTDFNLIQSKDGLPILENFQIKYGIVGN